MSLEYRNEEEAETEIADEQSEAVQRAISVVPYYSIIFIVCLIAVFLCQLTVDGQNSILFGGELSVLFAGFNKIFFKEGQYWRILTGATLHGGLIHLAFNGYALYVLGRLIETLSNRAHLAIVFVLSAIGGGILSLIFLPDVPSIGASGGIVGFLGYLTVYGFKRRKLLPDGFLKNMLFNIALMAFIGYYLRDKIDNFGHLGGLIVGAVYGFLQIPNDLYKDPREISPATKIFGLAACGIFILTSIFTVLLLSGVVRIPFPNLLTTPFL
ncbi:hypothetical protein BH10ACI1_BH10ACI1_25030 [soil metagenome]